MSRHVQAPGKGHSQRALRVGELVRHAVAEILARGDIHDPVIETHLITVPEVRMSPDLRLATVYVMPLGGTDEKDVLAALERNKRYLRGEVAHRVNLKFAPDIRFRVDERFAEAERIERLLRSPEVKRDLDKPQADSPQADSPHADPPLVDLPSLDLDPDSRKTK
jgi:ribosome-binding factor A